MGNVLVAFDVLYPDTKIPVGWSKSIGHIVFDVKMDFTRRATWVKDGHLFNQHIQGLFQEIALELAALNGIDVVAGDIQNA